MRLSTLLVALTSLRSGDAFSHSHSSLPTRRNGGILASTASGAAAPSTATQQSELSSTATKLKRVLAQEYVSFFDPMVSSWYDADVTFDDPLNSLSGVDAYRSNVDMLAGRTLMGNMLFEGAGISLHSVTGGEVMEKDGSVEIEDIVTRWTLRVTAKILPWKPEAVFSGISVYKLQPGGPEGITIVGQTDYWDSINIKEGQYQKVSKSVAIEDFLGQLQPDGFLAPPAAPELPFVLLRRGDGYELRQYPGFCGVETPYERRDYGFGSLGAFTKGMEPLAPSIMRVYNDNDDAEFKEKTMTWPLRFASPGEGSGAPSPPPAAAEKAGDGQWRSISLQSQPQRVVAVRTFEDVAMGPVVRNADRELRAMLKRDRLMPLEGSDEYVVFTQYDAVHSMGKRRSEVWIELKDGGHPF